MNLWSRPDESMRAEVILNRATGLQRELQLAAGQPEFFRRCLEGAFGPELVPEGGAELAFRAFAALEQRIERIEAMLSEPRRGEPVFRVDV